MTGEAQRNDLVEAARLRHRMREVCANYGVTLSNDELDYIVGYRPDNPKTAEYIHVYRDLRLDTVRRVLWHDDISVSLSPTEMDFMCQFMSQPMEVISYGRLVEAVYGDDEDGLGRGRLRVNICRLRWKLPGITRIHTVRGQGYVLR